MARRRRHSLAEIKDLILDSAEEIITRDGASKLTARQIALEIGYTVGSIYMVFPSMTHLLWHFNASTLDNIAERLVMVRQQEEAQKEQCLEELAKAYLNYASRNFNRWQVLFDFHPTEKLEPLEIDWFQQRIDALIMQFAITLHQLAPERPEPEITLAARSLWGGIHGIGTLFLVGKPHITSPEQLNESGVLLVRSFISGWLKPSVA
jgi:AcrR family transcriptional regulator